MEEIVGKSVLSGDGSMVDVSTICGNPDVEIVGVYFSAHWCPPCRGFTPQLAEFYNAVNKDKKRFEVVFASSDRDEESFKEYFKEMPWLAIPFSEMETKQKASQKYGIRGIPTLIILKKNGEMLSNEGRGHVAGSGNKWPEQWN